MHPSNSYVKATLSTDQIHDKFKATKTNYDYTKIGI